MHCLDQMQGIFRLLLRSPDPRGVAIGAVELAGIHWSISAFAELPAEGEVPAFVCVSYSWGRGRVAHPLDAAHTISDRAIPAIEAVVAALNPPAIWIDAVCMPLDEAARAGCLQALGAIYGRAEQVAVVLSNSCATALEQIRIDKRVDHAGLRALEGDDWVTRAWTYQEIANGRITQFVSEGGGPIAAPELLNRLGQAREDIKKTEGIDEFELEKRFPLVDRLENTLADYMISGLEQRFAYQSMVAMGQRFAERDEDHFNAMIGTIASDSSRLMQDLSLPPAERFRQACEARGDYSFIYCAGARSQEAGKSWRPAGETMHVMLSWNTYGDGQIGELCPTHLRLDGMYTPQRGALQSETARHIRERLGIDETIAPDGYASAVFERLATMGFNGCCDPVETDVGYFFPQTQLSGADGLCIVVATGLRWAFGAPGLVLEAGNGGIYRLREVGVFVGQLPQDGESIDLG